MSGIFSDAPAPVWPRIVAGLGLLWNLGGCWLFVMLASESGSSSGTGWTGFFAITAFDGLLGCIGLLLLKRWSQPLLLTALGGAVAAVAWLFLLGGANGSVLFVLLVVVAALLAWVAGRAAGKGWLA